MGRLTRRCLSISNVLITIRFKRALNSEYVYNLFGMFYVQVTRICKWEFFANESFLLVLGKSSFTSTLAFIIDQACLLQSFDQLYLSSKLKKKKKIQSSIVQACRLHIFRKKKFKIFFQKFRFFFQNELNGGHSPKQGGLGGPGGPKKWPGWQEKVAWVAQVVWEGGLDCPSGLRR